MQVWEICLKTHKVFCRLLQYSSAADLLLQKLCCPPSIPSCTVTGDVSNTC